ncbi:MAG: leucyl aminopeptidase family protein [Planctomycetota bacterium]
MLASVTVQSRGSAKALVVGQFAPKKKSSTKGAGLDASSAKLDASGAAKAAAERIEADGSLGSIAEGFPGKGAYERVIVVGLGDAEGFGMDRVRTAIAAVGRHAAKHKIASLELAFDGAFGTLKEAVDEQRAGCAAGEALGLLAWDAKLYRGPVNGKADFPRLSVRSGDRDFSAGLKRGLALAESANLTRTLSQTPPNIATTAHIAKACQDLAKKFPTLKCTVVKGERLAKEKMEGLINVGKASENEPCLVRLEYTPAGAAPKGKKAKPAVLVGKTITYDSGGLSIKVGGSMRGMKRDKDGGCAVIGAMHAIASTIKPKRRVVALLAVAENSISDEAYRPDDVLTFRNGVTVEVTNTDAEGRLVMADALCWACDKEDPAYIIDMATLTGGVVVALGSVHAGLWCDDDGLRSKIECAAEGTGERVWRLPHHESYNQMMRSQVADIVNSAPVREAHPIQGAAFLSYFVEKNIPWAHIDIAGTHATEKDAGPFIPGPTGFGARLLAELLEID